MLIELPHQWDPRPHQRRLWSYLQNGGKRAVAVWHRRAGKDSVSLNWSTMAMEDRVGNYWHLLPEYAQGRKAVWNAVDRAGRRIIDQAFPPQLRRRHRDDEMLIEWHNGATWQVGGSDSYDSLVGSNPVGVVFSEFSIARPEAWEFIRPILRENGGWAVFIYTPRGKNHGYALYEMARQNPEWFAELLTVKDTGLEHLAEAERRDGMSEDMIEQEYYCSWNASVQGAYYGAVLKKARDDGRICDLPYDQRYPVNTFWDIGRSDSTAIWFHQQVGLQQRFIGYYEASGEQVAHYVAELQRRGFVYGRHYLPHDATHKTLASASNKDGRSVEELLANLGVRPIEIVPRIDDLMVGIDLVRARFNEVWIDPVKCSRGLDCLGQYHKAWDERLQTFRTHPQEDWSVHGADAFRQWAQGYSGPGGHQGLKRRNRSAMAA